MDPFLPDRPIVCAEIAALVAFACALGFVLTRARPTPAARTVSWLAVVGLIAAVDLLTAAEPAGVRMLALIGVGLVAMKAPVGVAARSAGADALPFGRWIAFSLLWFGMQPNVFARRGSRERSSALALRGLARLLAGAALFFAARLAWSASGSRLVATLLALPGLSLALHFGVFDLVTALWRRLGFNAQPLFRAPLASQSLTEFWGRRWNLAFSEMASIAVYRPLVPRFGKAGATMTVFAFSGALHEMAISLPVRAGFGGPFAYFMLHGSLMLLENRLARRGTPIGGWRGRAWTIAWLVLPLPILFHHSFLAGIVWPLLGIPGSLS